MSGARKLAVVSDSKHKPGPRDALAAAISERDAALSTLETAQQAAERAGKLVADARAALVDATEHAEGFKATRAAAIAEAASRGLPGAPGGSSMREARAAEQDARDTLDAAEAARSSLAGRVADAEAAYRLAANKVDDEARAILGDHIGALLDRIEAAQSRLIFDRLALRWLVNNRLVPEWARASQILCRDVLPAQENGPHHVNHAAQWERLGAERPWQQALTALRSNASAALPETAP